MKKNGFTLIELIIVMAVIAILFAGAATAYKEYKHKQELAEQGVIPASQQYGSDYTDPTTPTTPSQPKEKEKPFISITTTAKPQCIYGYVVVGDKQLLDKDGNGVACKE